jgi:signal transduction histidine kinase
MSKEVLIVTAGPGGDEFAASIRQQLEVEVEIALNRRAGLLALRKASFDVVIVEESLIEGDRDWADRLWECSGAATPLVIHLALCGPARLTRQVASALKRRATDKVLARREAMAEIANELKTPLTGLLLESELALRDPSMPAEMHPKLRHVLELAGVIRERLRSVTPDAGSLHQQSL